MILRERIARKRDTELWLWALLALSGPKPHPGYDDNGCTRSPDYVLFTQEALWPACRYHDWHYSGLHKMDWLTRQIADDWFEDNLYRCIRHQQKPSESGWRIFMVPINSVRAWYYARGYAEAVRKLGARHFVPAETVAA
jgi:hypothetical protein